MKERPILFSAPMVRAILDGRKTQTRRVAKGVVARHAVTGEALRELDSAGPRAACPHGEPGDRLWVRETCCGEELPSGLDGVRYSADGAFIPIDGSSESVDRWLALNSYRNRRGAVVPAIHMPRWASRITLEITGARVQRLGQISEADAAAEGVDSVRSEGAFWQDYQRSTSRVDEMLCSSARDSFRTLWDILAPAGADWDANPWVWVIEFKVARTTTENGR